jgi:hypothetical protein
MQVYEVESGSTCVGDIRLCSIDVGFDARTSEFTIILPSEIEDLWVGYDRGEKRFIVQGTRDEVVQELTLSGYRIAR